MTRGTIKLEGNILHTGENRNRCKVPGKKYEKKRDDLEKLGADRKTTPLQLTR
jgi:hypothetical protein